MDLSTLLWLAVAVWLLIDIPTGGLITANVVGGATAAGGAAWREVAGSAKASYAARAARLAETKIGRWRLAAEAKAWNGGLKLQAAVAGLARGGARAVAEAAKAAPAGAAKGREARQRALAVAKEKGGNAVATAKAKMAVRTAKSEPEIVPGMGAPATSPGADKQPAPVVDCRVCDDGDCRACDGEGFDDTNEPCSSCTGTGVAPDSLPEIDWTDVPPCDPKGDEAKCQNPRCTAGDHPQISPAPSGSETEDHMSNLESAAEDRGVTPYLAAWDGETGMERIVGDLSALAERMQAAVEANRRHDPDGATDVIGKVQAAVEAAQAVGEAIDGKAAALHKKWDTAIENAKGTGADSANELVGAQ